MIIVSASATVIVINAGDANTLALFSNTILRTQLLSSSWFFRSLMEQC